MISGDSLPDSDHVLRYIRRKYFDRTANMIDGNAFLSRPAEHGGPSFNWMEAFEGDVEDRREAIKRLRRIRYERNGRLAQLNVGRTKAYAAMQAIDFRHDPLAANETYAAYPAHAYLAGVPEIDSPEGEAIGDLICQCVEQVFPVEPD